MKGDCTKENCIASAYELFAVECHEPRNIVSECEDVRCDVTKCSLST